MTLNPDFARRAAVATPPTPAPTIITDFRLFSLPILELGQWSEDWHLESLTCELIMQKRDMQVQSHDVVPRIANRRKAHRRLGANQDEIPESTVAIKNEALQYGQL